MSQGLVWTGRILSALSALFCLIDGAMKMILPAPVIETSAKLGYSAATLPGIGVALILSTLVYMIPRTSMLGAVLLTGYLGGAVASQVRIGAGAFEIVFPAIFACFVWGGLWLRDEKTRVVLPISR